MAKENKKIRLALVTPPFILKNTSFDNYAKLYSCLATKYNYDITFFVDSKIDYQCENIKVEKVFSFGYWSQLYKVNFFLGLPRMHYSGLVKKLKDFDIIDTSSPEFYSFANQCRKASKKYGSKLFMKHSTTFFDYFLFKHFKLVGLYRAKKFAKQCSGYNFTNPQARDAYVNLGVIDRNDPRIIILGHPVDARLFKPMKIKKSKKKILLSVGALYDFKGHQHIIRALSEIKSKQEIELWIVGNGGYKDELMKLAKELNLSEKVKFLGGKSHAELVMLYNQCDVFVLANELEVTPAVSEALLCGRPVVAVETGGLDFVMPDESYGLIANKGDIKELAKKINMLLIDEVLANNLAEKGRNYILDNFAVEKVAERMHKAFLKSL